MTAAIVACLAGIASVSAQNDVAYPGAVLTEVGNAWAYFTTGDSPEAVAKFYARKWRERGLPVVADSDGALGGIVSAFFTREGIQRSVRVRKQGTRTLAFVVARNLWVEGTASKEDSDLRRERTVFQQSLTGIDLPPASGHSASWVTLPLETAASQLKAALAGKGFQMVRESESSEGTRRRLVLEHVRGKDDVFSTLSWVDENTTVLAQTVMR